MVSSLVGTLNSNLSSVSLNLETLKSDINTLKGIFKTGLPKDSTSVNNVVLAALRVFSAAAVVVGSLYGIKATVNSSTSTALINLGGVSIYLPTGTALINLGGVITACIVFLDAFKFSANITSSSVPDATTTTSQQAAVQAEVVTATNSTKQSKRRRFRNKALDKAYRGGRCSYARHLTRRTWLQPIWIKFAPLWLNLVSKKFYGVNCNTDKP